MTQAIIKNLADLDSGTLPSAIYCQITKPYHRIQAIWHKEGVKCSIVVKENEISYCFRYCQPWVAVNYFNANQNRI